MTYAETLEFLYSSLPMFQREGAAAYKPGLENTAAFNALAAYPDRKFISVHIAGTNGKGSTSHMLASVMQQAGLRTGLFTSPHLKDFRERIRVDSEMIPEADVVEFVEKYREYMISCGLTFFEMCTVMAFSYFAKCGVQFAVIEAGLGGRLDSTNIIIPRLSIITNIGFDHTNLLGDTLHKIAGEKAGIIKQDIPVIIGCHDPATDEVFMNYAAQKGSSITFADSLFRVSQVTEHNCGQRFKIEASGEHSFEMEIDLQGSYQRKNILTLLAACRELGISQQAILAGCADTVKNTGLKGRWQILSRYPLTICDTGHNAHGIKEVVEQLKKQKYNTLYFILGVVADKDLDAVLPLLPPDAHYIFTQPSTPRALCCKHLADAAMCYGLKGETAATVPAAMKIARSMATGDDLIFVGGSTYTVADIPDL